MSEYDYAWEKLRGAVDSVAGEGDKREQLLNALVSALCRIKPNDHLPPEIREDFEQMMKNVTEIPTIGIAVGYETCLDVMSDNAVSEVISQVRRFYDVVRRHRESDTE